jgi:hypothetical protein
VQFHVIWNIRQPHNRAHEHCEEKRASLVIEFALESISVGIIAIGHENRFAFIKYFFGCFKHQFFYLARKSIAGIVLAKIPPGKKFRKFIFSIFLMQTKGEAP